MKIAETFRKLMATRWLPATSAVLICFGAFIFFEHRFQNLLMTARLTLNDIKDRPNEREAEDFATTVDDHTEVHGCERVSASPADSIEENPAELSEGDIQQEDTDELSEAESADQDLWVEVAEQEFRETNAFADPNEDGQEQALTEPKNLVQPAEGTPVPTVSDAQSSSNPLESGTTPPWGDLPNPRSAHISFAPSAPRPEPKSTPKARRRDVFTDIITTALSTGSSVTINPPSTIASPSKSSPNTFPRTPFPYDPSPPSFVSSILGRPGPFPWAKLHVPKRVKRTPLSYTDTRQEPMLQMPTIVEEGGVGLGLGISDALGDAAAEQRRRSKRKRRQARRGSKKGSMES